MRPRSGTHMLMATRCTCDLDFFTDVEMGVKREGKEEVYDK